MGAGISKEQERKAKYRGLQSALREFRKAGVDCRYGEKAVFGNGFRMTYGPTLAPATESVSAILTSKLARKTTGCLTPTRESPA